MAVAVPHARFFPARIARQQPLHPRARQLITSGLGGTLRPRALLLPPSLGLLAAPRRPRAAQRARRSPPFIGTVCSAASADKMGNGGLPPFLAEGRDRLRAWAETSPRPQLLTLALLAVLLAAVAWARNLSASGLIDDTEPLFAEAARQMALTGDWLTPRFNLLVRKHEGQGKRAGGDGKLTERGPR